MTKLWYDISITTTQEGLATMTTQTFRIRAYNDCLDALRGRQSRKIDNHTYLETRENGIAVRLHETDVLLYQRDNTLVLSTGGYATKTTCERMTMYSPFRVYQKQNVLYVATYTGTYRLFDGITFDLSTDTPLSVENAFMEEVDAWNTTVLQLLKTYLDSLTGDVIQACIQDTMGDCWYCMMHTQDGQPLGETFAQEKNESNHLYMHLQDGYYMGSLFYNALVASSYTNPAFILHGGYVQHVKDAVRKYMKNALLIRA